MKPEDIAEFADSLLKECESCEGRGYKDSFMVTPGNKCPYCAGTGREFTDAGRKLAKFFYAMKQRGMI